MANTTPSTPKIPKDIEFEPTSQMPFAKLNVIVMAASVLAIIVGFMLMAGGGSDDPNVFSEEIFSTRRIVVGPAIALLGFVGVGVGIIIGTRGKKQTPAADSQAAEATAADTTATGATAADSAKQ